MKHLILVLLILLTYSSCGSKRKVITRKKPTVTISTTNTPRTKAPKKTTPPKSTPGLSKTENYISNYRQIAMDEMKNYGVPASITLAQGILESGNGIGRLSVEANNHFGIKCHGWKGEKIYHDDDASQECFRKYKEAKYSFRDHSLFLKDRKRYYKLFLLEKDDYKNWAKELRKAGYATDPKYPAKLISLIERYNLDQYDDMVLGNTKNTKPKKNTSNGITHQVSQGDTLYSISKKYNTSVALLKEINKLTNNNLTIGQTLIIQL